MHSNEAEIFLIIMESTLELQISDTNKQKYAIKTVHDHNMQQRHACKTADLIMRNIDCIAC